MRQEKAAEWRLSYRYNRRAPERCAVVDAVQPVDDVQKAIRALVQKRLGGMAA